MKKSGLLFILSILITTLLSAQIQDGIIERDEYSHRAVFKGGDFVLHWKISEGKAAFAMDAKTTGWVSIGFEPTVVMKDADMIFGWVNDQGETFVLDCYSTGMFGPHPPDTDLGGTEDIIAFGGREQEGRTVIEFLRPLTSTDPYDRNLPASGEVDIIWAYGETDNFEEIHRAAGSALINLGSGDSEGGQKNSFFVLHMLLMSLSLLVMLTAVVAVRLFRKRKWWLKVHRPLGLTASVLAMGGFVSALIFVGKGGVGHFRVPHAWWGLAAVVASLTAPFLGQTYLKTQENKALFRKLHRRTGWTAFLLMVLAALLGFRLLGLI